MMRTGINYDDVATAASEIEQSGERPTIEKVRSVLGGTGSNSTISKYLQSWRNSRPANKVTITPPPDQVQAAVSAVWEKLHQETELTIATVKAEASEQVSAARQEAETVTTAMGALTTEHETLKNQYHALSAQKELLALDYKQAESNQLLLRERLEALESRRQEIKSLHEQQLKRLEEKYVAEIERLKAHADQEVQLAHQLTDTLKTHYEESRIEHMRQRDELTTEQRKKDTLIKQLEVDQATLKQALEAKATLYQQVKTELHEAQKMIQTQQAQWESLQDKRFVTEDIVTAFNVLPAQVASELQALLAEQVKVVIEQAATALRKQCEDIEHA